MVKEKKNIARLVLQGISILGILFGLSFFCCASAIIPAIQKERSNLAIQCGMIIFSGVLLILSIYLIYASYLMFRGRAFGAIYSISVFLALIFSRLFDSLIEIFTTTSYSGKMSRFIEDILGFASLLFFLLVYLICVMLLKKLLKLAYSPQETSGTQHSTDKQ
jgi:hypothetical protein